MSEDPNSDYGGKGQNRRLAYPGRGADWARMSPGPFLNRRWPRRDWSDDFPLWKKAPPAAVSDQESIEAGLLDAIWFEVIRQTPLSVEGPFKQGGGSHAAHSAGPNQLPAEEFRQALQSQLHAVLAQHPKPPGVEQLSLYDSFQALANGPRLFVETLGHVGVVGTRLPRDFEYWRDWIARRGPIVGLMWVDKKFRVDGSYDTSDPSTREDTRPAAVVISGYDHQFKSPDSIEVVRDNYLVRPAFKVESIEAGRDRQITVDGDFAEQRFLEAFGLTIDVAA